MNKKMLSSQVWTVNKFHKVEEKKQQHNIMFLFFRK